MTAARRLRFGIQAGPTDLPFSARCELWQAAERLGYDWASVSDHLAQLPVFGAHDTDPWLEAWTQLAALAQATRRIRIGTLVSSVGYRDPAVLAKMAATLDVISAGRLDFGLGAGYAEAEYRMYGLPFPRPAQRLTQLDEALHICKLLWTQERSDFRGEHFTLHGAVCEPKPLQRPHPPIWVGGMGEKKTLRIVAEHADGWNAFPLPIDQLSHKLTVLREHCQVVGRDFGTIQKQLVISAIVREDSAAAQAEVARFAEERHLPPDRAAQMVMLGSPEEVAARLRPYAELGFDTFVLMERNPVDYPTVDLFIQQVAPRLAPPSG
jgi:F420-dependent oxidoreductase-like protein